MYEIHIGSPRTSRPRPNCFVIDIMGAPFSVAFNKCVSISLLSVSTCVLDFKVKDKSRWGGIFALLNALLVVRCFIKFVKK